MSEVDLQRRIGAGRKGIQIVMGPRNKLLRAITQDVL